MACCERFYYRCSNRRYVGYIAKGGFVRLCFLGYILACIIMLGEYSASTSGFVVGIIFAFLGILFLAMEAGVTLCYSDRGERRRFFPCLFIFLMATVPIICVLERSTSLCSKDTGEDVNGSPTNEPRGSFGLDILPEDPRMLVKILEQCLVFILILGRWILPRGYVSRERLSDMLLAYVGMSADMLDFLTEGIENEQVKCDGSLNIAILLVFSLSLFQFPIGLINFIDKKNAIVGKEEVGQEVMSIFANILMQDAPYLIIRMYLLTSEDHVIDDSTTDRIFFAMKNVLVLLLQTYRLCILWRYIRNHGNSNISYGLALQEDPDGQLIMMNKLEDNCRYKRKRHNTM